MQLTDPLPLAGRTAPSRVLFGPHETNLGSGPPGARGISARHVAYYARRAAGGAGVVVVETASVHPDDWPYERAPLAAACGPGWAAVADACRPHGTVVLAGLGHTGGQGSSAWSQAALWAPSRVADVVTRELPMEMEQPELTAVVAGFAGAAATAVAAGLDGVEVDAGATALLRQFASGLTNTRTDGYGTDRLRLLREVLTAVRAAISPDRVLALRLSVDESAPWAGITPEAAAEHVRELAPLVDLLTVVRGSAMDLAAHRPDGHRAPGFHVEPLRAAAAGTLLVAQGSVVDVDRAQDLLDRGADAVEMTRAQIADADLVAKLRAGTPGRIRPCVLCNQACLVRDERNPLVSCVVDPRSGHETTEPDVEVPSGSSGGRRVVVAGAGPAGLEAARVLALRGHAVTVADPAPRPGGLLPTVAALPGRGRFALFADWLVAECTRAGVRFETTAVTGADVDATGGRPGPLPCPVSGTPVRTPAEVLAGRDVPAGVLVHDPLGGPVGVGVAELLAARGHRVTLVTPDTVVGSMLGSTGDLAPANGRLARAGVARETATLLREVRDGVAVLEDRWSGQTRTLAVDVLVPAGHRLPGEHTDAGGDGPAAGDVVAPRTVLEAVLEGRRAALAVDAAGPGARGPGAREVARCAVPA